MKAIFLGGNYERSLKALMFLHESQYEIKGFVIDFDKEDCGIQQYCKEKYIPYYKTDEFYQEIEDNTFKEIDVIFSFGYCKKIYKNIIELSQIGIINFHAAPLPEYKGTAIYCHAMSQRIEKWGVSAHFVDEDFDTGDIIEVDTFDIDYKKIETGQQFAEYNYEKLYDLFKKIVLKLKMGDTLPRIPQKGGKYYSKKDLENLRIVDITWNKEMVNNRVNALWHPPYEGAYIMIDGKKFYLINEEILRQISKLYK